MNQNLILEKLSKTRLLPLFYKDDVDISKNLIDALISTNLHVIEFTNRGADAKRIFPKLLKHVKDKNEVILGIGSIKSSDEAKLFIDLGAKFIVSPHLDEEIGEVCNKNEVLWVPGCGTLSEMIKADKIGAKLIKLFPGNVYGSKFISSVLAPCPWLKIMPTGGVTTQQSNIQDWLDSGAYCLGMGSNLFPSSLLNFNDTTELQKHINSVLKKIRSVSK
tara:strand:+ start:492 stop:1148 length:657 start_codon:yes stop_codon:yes gene_type:complete